MTVQSGPTDAFVCEYTIVVLSNSTGNYNTTTLQAETTRTIVELVGMLIETIIIVECTIGCVSFVDEMTIVE